MEHIVRKLTDRMASFLALESSSGLVLVAAAALALLLSNSPADKFYEQLLATPVGVRVGPLELAKPLLLWINDGLMAVFFLLVGLEIKREVLEGELSTPAQLALPVTAALGGMAVPALIYVLINRGDPIALGGWAIPTATDIAFALGVLALLGKQVPLSLKVFLTAVAIADDLGAIVIIALFYTEQLSIQMLGLACAAIAALVALNRLKVTRIAAYALIGLLLWVFVLKSGVHATLAGVAVALAIPLRTAHANGASPLHRLEQDLHPWVAFGVLPVFAFANAGLSLHGVTIARLLEPLPLGIALGLFAGKLLGVFSASFVLIKLQWATLPDGASWSQLFGVALLCGIGFTMSLFIGTLAFETEGQSYAAAVRLGVLGGSVLSALSGYAFLRWASRAQRQDPR